MVPRLYIAVSTRGVERVTIGAPSARAREVGVNLYRGLVTAILELDAAARRTANDGEVSRDKEGS